jgi:twitching motility protein PilT
MLSKEQEEKFLGDREIDFSHAAKDGVRFRGNGFFQRGSISIALRHIPNVISSIGELRLPPILESFTQKPQGFFLCVGPVGQGKSTTLAAMLEHINQTRAEHIVTIEDPIEYIFEPKKSLIDQREVRVDTSDFHIGLHSAFRQDVDIIMVGEMRGRETISTAVTAAETGHLVLSTLHTNNAAQTIDRIIDTFPSGQQDQIRIQLSGSLSAIFSQRLVPRIAGGLIPAYELLINNSAVSNLIRERRTHEIQTVIETSSESGMIDMNRSLVELVQKGEITVENAFAYSINPKGLERLM